MAKLRHIAMVVEDMENTALFYEKSFGMERVRASDTLSGAGHGRASGSEHVPGFPGGRSCPVSLATEGLRVHQLLALPA